MKTALIYLGVNLVLCIIALVLVLSDAGINLPFLNNHTKRNLMLIPGAIFGCLDAILIVLCSKLYCFHIYLIKSNQTTLTYILSHKDKRKNNQIAPKESTNISNRPSFRRDLGAPTDTERVMLSKDLTVAEPKFSEEEIKGQLPDTHDNTNKMKTKAKLSSDHNPNEEIKIKKLRRPNEESQANLLRSSAQTNDPLQLTEAKPVKVKRSSEFSLNK